MELPWRNNQKLIKALYEELNQIKEHVQVLEKEDEFTKILDKIKKNVKDQIIKEMATTEISKAIAKVVLEEIKKSKTGIV